MRPNLPLALLSVSLCAVQAQVAPTAPGSQPVAPSAGAGTLPDPLTWPVTARDWNTTTREFSEALTNALTGEVTAQPHQVIQVGNGLNYLDASGAWQPSQDLIELTPDGGAAAVKGPLKVYFSPAGLNNDAALTIITPGQQALLARVQGVYLFDGQSGQGLLLAAPSDSAVAELHPPNQVVYRSAFASDALEADLRYTCTKAGIECDVIITRQPGLSPQDCGFNPATTLLQVRHQWQNAPPPASIHQITVGQGTGAGTVDEFIDLGELFFPPGRAFLTDGSSSTDTNAPAQISIANAAAGGGGVPVTKEWQTWGGPGGSSLLIESVAWPSIATNLAQLPLMAEAEGPATGDFFAAAATSGIQLAGEASPTAGVVLDWQTVEGGVSFDFTNGTTWLVNVNCYFSGTLTFEAGCVVKYLSSTMLVCNYGKVQCNGTPASPSILTCAGDAQYGQGLGGYSLSQSADPALWIFSSSTSQTIQSLVVRYATLALEFYGSAKCGSPSDYVNNCFLFNCGTGVSSDARAVSISSSLCYEVTTPIEPGYGCTISGSFGAGAPPTATFTSPSCQVLEQGSSATWTVAVSPSYPSTEYQWYLGAPIIGATNQSVTVQNPADGDNCTVLVYNPFGYCGAASALQAVSVLDTSAWAIWTDLLALTNTTTASLWKTTPPLTDPPTGMAWNTNCLIYHKFGLTAISQMNSWDIPCGCPGQIPVTALTGRHGYARGHGMGTPGTNNPMAPALTVWFCTTNNPPNNLVPVNVLADIVRYDSQYDYTVLVFDSDVSTMGITPMYVGDTPQSDTPILVTSQYPVNNVIGSVIVNSPVMCGNILPLYSYQTMGGPMGGDSGSPLMVPTTDNYLVFIGGIGYTTGAHTTGPCTQMQTDMDTLSTDAGLNPASYQMRWHGTD
ncbi:MAG: hypothetical protein ACLQM8_18995 [Limisphaerales bacterium]